MKTALFLLLSGSALLAGLAYALRGHTSPGAACEIPSPPTIPLEASMEFKVVKTDAEWKAFLTPEQYRVMRQGGTERPFTGAYNDNHREGVYLCPGCGTPLFASSTKYDHGSGWPSFTAPIDPKNLLLLEDPSYGMHRTEVRCAVCGAHLGHLFDDGPAPSGLHYCINSASLEFKPADPATAVAGRTLETAAFAAGCFWGVQSRFDAIPGVVETTVGYSGGAAEHPSYKQVCSDATGHAETVQVEYDPARITYAQLLDAFFKMHDPTTRDRQGPDVGSQYRSAVFYHSEEQKREAEAKIAELEKAGTFKRSIVTQVLPAGPFWPAEEYHQKYYQKRGGSCAL